MNLRKYSQPIYMQWFKITFAVSAFLYPVYFLVRYSLNPVLPVAVVFFLCFFIMMCFLITAYFFQDIWSDEEGLFVEFLWKKIRIEWEDVVEMKKIMPFGPGVVILVKSLTPFHRIFGILYGFSLNPAFIIHPTISNYEILNEEIKKHIKKSYQ